MFHIALHAYVHHLHYLKGYCGQRNFIAAQTPMKHTEEDVWEMIWMEKCSSVVVLCDFLDGKEVYKQDSEHYPSKGKYH